MMSRPVLSFMIVALVICGCAALRSTSQRPTIADEEVVTVTTDDPTIVLPSGERIAIDGLDDNSTRLKMTRFKDDRGRIVVDFDSETVEPGSPKVQ